MSQQLRKGKGQLCWLQTPIGFPLKRSKEKKIELARRPNRNNMLDSRLSATPQGNS
jgi:hypothetical protein